MGRRVICVTGLHGAWLNQVAFRFEKAGGLIVWPSQDLTLSGAESAYKSNAENIELTRIHDSIFDACKLSWWDQKRPKFFDTPCPGPEEYIAQFPEDSDIVLVDYRLCLFIPLWHKYITDFVFVGQEKAAVYDTLRRWVPKSDSAAREGIIDCYLEAVNSDIGLLDKVWYIENNTIRENAEDFEITRLRDSIIDVSNVQI